MMTARQQDRTQEQMEHAESEQKHSVSRGSAAFQSVALVPVVCTADVLSHITPANSYTLTHKKNHNCASKPFK